MSASDASNGGETTRLPAIERFAAKCRFDPTTGCVLWIGGTSSSRGGTGKQGSFWADGRRQSSAKWAAEHIHKLPTAGHTIVQTCGNSLCVEHLQAVIGGQTKEARYNWMGISKGFLEPEPTPEGDPDAPPFFLAPEWFRPFLPKMETNDDPF